MAEDPLFSSSCSLVLVPSKPAYFVLIKSCLRRNWVLAKINNVTGELKFSFTQGKDIFPTETAALDYLKRSGPIEVVGSGKHVLGYVVIGSTALLLIAEKVRVSAMLPGNHAVKSVAVSKWHRIALQREQDAGANGANGVNTPAKEEQARGIEKVITFYIDGAHYFCETLDLTRPFPSERPVCQPSWEFVWNRWLSTSWHSIGLGHVCPLLLQGLCEERPLHDFDGAPYQVVMVSRRGRLHVGPRYRARGLNELAEPGNEIECEQIIWRLQPGADMRKAPIQWSRYTWRRGSVPLWWGVTIKNNGMGEAEIKIQQKCTFKGSRRYMRRLQKRFTPNPHLDPDEEVPSEDCVDPSLRVPLVFVSLLRKGTPDKDRSETKLASAFDAMVGAMRKEHRLPLTYIALDWHEIDKAFGHEGTVEAFWSQIGDVLPKHGFALGTMTKVGLDHTDPSSLLEDDGNSSRRVAEGMPCRGYTTAGRGWRVQWFRQQRGLMRYNCADSLDRTNVSSFFGAIQVFVEQCRELDIAIALSPKGMNGIAALMRKPSQLQRSPSQGNAAAAQGMGGMAAIEKIGKELNKGLLAMMQDLKTPRGGATPGAPARGNGILDSTTKAVPAVPLVGSSQATPQQQAAQQLQQQQQQQPPATVQDLQAQLDRLDAAGPLPLGWEAKIDRISHRIFYVDHNSKTTSWERPPSPAVRPPSPAARPPLPSPLISLQSDPSSGAPGVAPSTVTQMTGSYIGAADHRLAHLTLELPPTPSHIPGADGRLRLLDRGLPTTRNTPADHRDHWEPLSPWGMLKADAKKFGKRISPEALSATAELFLVNGDLSAWLYTGSQAMHSERMLIFEPADSKLRKAGIGQYGGMIVGLKRRFNNVWVDADRQMQVDMFLGLKHKEYFPSTYLPYKVDLAVPLDFPESDDEQDPVGMMDWPMTGNDKGAPEATAAAGTALANRHARRFSSQDLFNLFGQQSQAPDLLSMGPPGSILAGQPAPGVASSKSESTLQAATSSRGLGETAADSGSNGCAENLASSVAGLQHDVSLIAFSDRDSQSDTSSITGPARSPDSRSASPLPPQPEFSLL